MLLRSISLSSLIIACWATAAPAQVVLERKFADGTQFKTRETVKVKQSLVLSGIDLGSTTETTVTSHTTYGKRDAQGDLPVTMKFESLTSDLKLPGGVALKFDSAAPEVKSDNPTAALILDSLRKTAGSTLTYRFDRENQVQSVEGVQEGGLQPSPDEVKEELQRDVDLIPEKPLKPGDTWEQTVTRNLGQGQVFTFLREFQYVGRVAKFPTVKDGKQFDKITAKDTSVTYSTKGNAGAIKVTKSDLKVDTSEHTYLFDRAAGRLVDSRSQLRVMGPLGLSVANMDLSGDLDLTMEIRREEVE
ncbi:MAG TPA: hypothetical protein VMV69_20810 [Pirellulales bacterium]|nr:hypothetical protein [Pirellulales bacterium]